MLGLTLHDELKSSRLKGTAIAHINKNNTRATQLKDIAS